MNERLRTYKTGITRAWHQMSDAPRLLLAAKTALAAVIAWATVPWIPLAQDQYAYYAPLGVLVSMYPTVAASAKSGAQALIGLAVGIGLGVFGVTLLIQGVPVVIALAIIVALGVLLSGVQALGAGREWVAVAGLFVMLLSGRDVEGYSLSYLLTMLWGIIVGVVVNLVIVPPLYLRRASEQLSMLRDGVVSVLTHVADQLETSKADTAAITIEIDRLTRVADDVSFEVKSADESSRVNPRARWHRGQQRSNAREMHSLERIASHAKNVAGVLERLEEPGSAPLHGAVRTHAVSAVRACAALVATFDGTYADPHRLTEAEGAVEKFLVALNEAPGGEVAFRSEVWTVGFALRRIVDASQPLTGAEQT